MGSAHRLGWGLRWIAVPGVCAADGDLQRCSAGYAELLWKSAGDPGGELDRGSGARAYEWDDQARGAGVYAGDAAGSGELLCRELRGGAGDSQLLRGCGRRG